MKISYKWGSHLVALTKVIPITTGDVLEMGTGLYSTPYLHWACFGKRKLVSYDNNPTYIKYAMPFSNNEHQVIFVEKWEDANIEKEWDVALIDNEPSYRRKEEIKRLSSYSKYIIVHDTEDRNLKDYMFDEIYPLFKYRYDFSQVRPQTTVLSNFTSLENLWSK
jgi:hypothetical protein